MKDRLGVHSLVPPGELPNISAARQTTRDRLERTQKKLEAVALDDDASIVLMGSWGRQELTSGSDDDFMVLFNGDQREDPRPSGRELDDLLGSGDAAPGPEEIFGVKVWLGELRDRLGPSDSNKNLTRRMLLILESVAGAGPGNHADARRALIESYLQAAVKDYRPPRYFLNDLVRYWRTIAVDFEGKLRERGEEGWGLRNVKLRLSRKALFASGLLPLLRCGEFEADRMADYLEEQFAEPPLDRIATAFFEQGMIDEGSRALRTYDEFLGVLDDANQRKELKRLTPEDRSGSMLFARMRELGQEFEDSLLALLFDDEQMVRLTREYLVF